jgi:branched-chain amino acid aminotransferase
LYNSPSGDGGNFTMSYFNFNGKILAANTSTIGPENRGVRYGDGLFETIKMKEGKLLFEDDHFARLWKGLKVLQFDLPKHFTPESLQEQIVAVAKKNDHMKSARIRLNVFRGDGSLYDAVNLSPNYFIQTWALLENSGELNNNGLVMGIYPDAKKTYDILSNLKHNNYLPYLMGALHAKKEKWNDAIILNSAGRICDTTIANIFIIKDEVIYTPSLTEACVAGVMRNYIIRNSKSTGFELIEKELTQEDVLNADEVFITNTIRNIQWIQSINNKTYSNTVIKKICAALLPALTWL